MKQPDAGWWRDGREEENWLWLAARMNREQGGPERS